MRPNNNADDGPTVHHTLVTTAASVITSLLQDRLIANESDQIAIGLWGSRKVANDDGEAIVWPVPLGRVGPAALQFAEQLARDAPTILARYNLAQPTDLLPSSLLWSISSAFATLPAPSTLTAAAGVTVSYTKRVFLFTTLATPGLQLAPPDVTRNDRVVALAVDRAKDAAAAGVSLDLFVGHDGPFDLAPMYGHILRAFAREDDLIRQADGDLAVAEALVSRFIAEHVHEATEEHDLFAQVRRRSFAKRSQAAVAWRISDGVEIAVRLYSLVQETKKGAYVWLDGRTNRALRRETTLLDEATGAAVPATRVGSALEYGNNLVPFSPDELTKLKSGGTAVGLDLLGFKDRALLRDWHNVKHASFVRPDELAAPGSTVTFVALLQTLHRRDKFALVRVTPRASSAPRLAALLPSLGAGATAVAAGADAEAAADEAVLSPDGFHLIWLPFADDLRELEPKNLDAVGATPTEGQVALARAVVRKLRIRHNPLDIENPGLRLHYAALQALALDRESVDAVVDTTLPQEEGFQRAAGVIGSFASGTMPTTRGAATPGAAKRGAPSAAPDVVIPSHDVIRGYAARGPTAFRGMRKDSVEAVLRRMFGLTPAAVARFRTKADLVAKVIELCAGSEGQQGPELAEGVAEEAGAAPAREKRRREQAEAAAAVAAVKAEPDDELLAPTFVPPKKTRR